MNSVWREPVNPQTTMPFQELLISSSTDYSRCNNSDQIADDKSMQKLPYKKACERPPVSVARRNARERKRVHTVNQMFSILKTRLPSLHQKTKRVSKLKILKAAMDYIYDLQDILDDTSTTQSTILVNEHLRSSLVSECYYPNHQQQVEKIPAFETNGHVAQQSSATTIVVEDCHQGTSSNQRHYGPKWGTLSLPAVPLEPESNIGGPPPLSFNECNRTDSFCQIPTFLTDISSYDPKYYYYGNQGYHY